MDVFHIAGPMEQFEIRRLAPLEIGGFDVSFTNSSLYMGVVVAVVCALLYFGSAQAQLVPNRLQSVTELIYGFVHDMVVSVIGEKGAPFFPFVFTLFSFILAANLIGMAPGSFTVTSHLVVTAALGILVFAIVLGVGLARQGFAFFARFYPSSAPWWIAWLIAIIEVISFVIRPGTLAVRLFANMLAGHSMLKVLGGFVPLGLAASGVGLLAAFGSLLGVVAVTALEFLVAVLQAYVFAILTCVYLSEVVSDHHH